MINESVKGEEEKNDLTDEENNSEEDANNNNEEDEEDKEVNYTDLIQLNTSKELQMEEEKEEKEENEISKLKKRKWIAERVRGNSSFSLRASNPFIESISTTSSSSSSSLSGNNEENSSAISFYFIRHAKSKANKNPLALRVCSVRFII